MPAIAPLVVAERAVGPSDGGPATGSADYPPAALHLRVQGDVAVLLDVHADGTIASCTVSRSSGHAVLDAAACPKAVREGRAAIQRDEHSRPIAYQTARTIAWRLPTGDAGRLRKVRIEALGATRACIADYGDGERRLPAGLCADIAAALPRERGDGAGSVSVWLPDRLPIAR